MNAVEAQFAFRLVRVGFQIFSFVFCVYVVWTSDYNYNICTGQQFGMCTDSNFALLRMHMIPGIATEIIYIVVATFSLVFVWTCSLLFPHCLWWSCFAPEIPGNSSGAVNLRNIHGACSSGQR